MNIITYFYHRICCILNYKNHVNESSYKELTEYVIICKKVNKLFDSIPRICEEASKKGEHLALIFEHYHGDKTSYDIWFHLHYKLKINHISTSSEVIKHDDNRYSTLEYIDF
jgi:hypothetical protein